VSTEGAAGKTKLKKKKKNITPRLTYWWIFLATWAREVGLYYCTGLVATRNLRTEITAQSSL